MRDSDVKREIDNMTEKKANPFSVAQEQYDARWDMIFGRDKGDKERDVEFDKAQDALDKKADNARELGLDYEPEQKVITIDDIEKIIKFKERNK